MMVNSSQHIQGQKAQLILHSLSENYAHCIHFSYFLYDKDGFSPGLLNVFIRVNNGSLGDAVWNVSKSHGKQWLQAELAVGIFYPDNYQVIFEAVILPEQRGYIALDDIQIVDSTCTNTTHFQPLRDMEMNSEQDVTFHCVTSGQMTKAQSLSLQRQHGGVINPSAQPESINPAILIAIFQLQQLTKQNQDLYRCVIQSESGAGVSNFAALIVKEPPTPAAAPKMIKSDSTYLVLDLNINHIHGDGPIIQKEIIYQKISKTCTTIPIFYGSSYTLRYLDPDTEYQIGVRLTRPGKGGRGDIGPKLISKTTCAEPVQAPNNIISSEIKPRQVTLQWEPLEYNSTRCHTYFYTVCYHYTFRVDYFRRFQECQTVPQNVSSFIIRKLLPHTDIYVKITVLNPIGRRESEELKFQTDEDVPGRISTEFIRSLSTEDMITLKWKEPKVPNGVITQYEVSYQCIESSDPAVITSCPKKTLLKGRNETNHTFKNLEPGTTYRFSIRASTVKGFGSRVFTMITTNISAPLFVYGSMPSPLEVTNTTITVQLKPARGRGAPISVYHIVVKQNNLHKVKQEPRTQKCFPLPIKWEEAATEDLPYYYSAELTPSSLPGLKPFTVGDNGTYNGYWNVPLVSKKNYSIYFQAMSNFKGEKKINCVLIAEKAAYKGSQKDVQLSHQLSLILSICAGSLVVFILILLYVNKGKCTQRNRTLVSPHHNRTNRTNVMARSSTDLLEDLDSSSRHSPNAEQHNMMNESISLSENLSQRPCHQAGFPYQTQKLYRAVQVADLHEHINQMKSAEDYGFKQEYESLFQGQSSCQKMSKKRKRCSESQCVNVTINDCRRATLPTYLEDPGFIYLSYADSKQYRRLSINRAEMQYNLLGALKFKADHKAKYFIAAQGPKQEMVYDFWRMMWQEHCGCIVMINKLVEVGQVNCCKYWPDDTENYGDISVTLIKTEVRAEYTVRIFSLQKMYCSARREILQFHFTAWPEHGVPDHATGLLALIRRVKAANPPESGPLVVHCSTGTGRTGCYIALDVLMDMATYEGVIDVYNFVKTLSSWRINMIQTEEQYIFIHKAILEAHQCGDTSIPVNKFKSTYKEMIRVDPQSNSSQLSKEFQVLNSVASDPDGENSSISFLPQKEKNCNVDSLPPDKCLPLLVTVKDESNKYTNATLLDSYRQATAFVVTPHPFQKDAADFWRLVYDCKCSSIIMLNQLNELNSAWPGLQYWPESGVQQYGPIQVKFISCRMNKEICVSMFEVRNLLQENYLTVKHFQYLQWPTNSCVPKSKKSFFNLLRTVEKWQARCGDGRIAIHRLNGEGDSGVFCALISIMEMIKYQKMVDVFHTVQTLRHNKPNMVESLEQYQFCYDIALEYLEFWEVNGKE
ncbi:receptor-type tyrosine-protein phosphatase U-like [Chiloscyllium plagiosum]|uniref:receptor-type tyrosine-protein phosphatase U-like n=1 Tax=Chiloscyllium plagiosum TaxID=36176 RepID=UPI001CB7BBF1|nr:receptor-type tyrosine-protein phosphatase U-like [Chiloscyllium plagiosum]